MTDDTFWEGPGEFNGERVEHDYAQTVAALRVLYGDLDLGAAIPEAVADSVCTHYDPAG